MTLPLLSSVISSGAFVPLDLVERFHLGVAEDAFDGQKIFDPADFSGRIPRAGAALAERRVVDLDGAVITSSRASIIEF